MPPETRSCIVITGNSQAHGHKLFLSKNFQDVQNCYRVKQRDTTCSLLLISFLERYSQKLVNDNYLTLKYIYTIFQTLLLMYCLCIYMEIIVKNKLFGISGPSFYCSSCCFVNFFQSRGYCHFLLCLILSIYFKVYILRKWIRNEVETIQTLIMSFEFNFHK
jgi:hypothetical protein